MDAVIVKFVIQNRKSGNCRVVEYDNCENKYHATRLINVYKPTKGWKVIKAEIEFTERLL